MPPRVLRIGVNDFPASFNPNTDSQGVKGYVTWMAYRPVTAYDKNWNLVCILCSELPSREKRTLWTERLPSGESVVAMRYTIRPEAVWADGTAITTKDVLFTLEVGRNPAAGWVSHDFFEREIHSIQAIDSRTFVLRRRTQACEAEQINGFLLLPAHIEEPVYRADPDGYRIKSRYETETTRLGLWSGPYRPVSVTSGREIVFERNARWYGKPPFFDRVVVQTFEQTRDLEKALLEGAIDYVAGEYGFTPQTASQIQRHYGYRFDILWGQGSSFRQVSLNHDEALFKDLRVRRALLLSLDRPSLNRRLYYGRNVLALTDTNPLDTVFHPNVREYGFDPAEAGRLLDEAGWKSGPDGIRRNDTGTPLSFDLWAAAGDRTIDLEVQFLEEMWRKVGVGVNVRRAPARVLFGEILPERRFSGAAVFSWIAAPREAPRSLYHSTQIPTAENGFTGQNYLGYSNARMDEILDRITASCTPPMSEDSWKELQVLFAEELPSLPLFYQASAFIFPKWLKGVEPTGHLFDTSLTIENWHREDPPADAGPVERVRPSR